MKEDDSSGEKKEEREIEVEKRETDEPAQKKNEELEEPKKSADPQPKKEKLNLKKNEETSEDLGDLEQRRNMLQTIKDFDFEIKKNQEDIGKIVEKVDLLTKDLDDLVSLYEIVSEQMNPFVGLSKVTKKRIEALEHFTQRFDDMENRLGEMESGSVNPSSIADKKLSQTQKQPIEQPPKEGEKKTEVPEKPDDTDKTEKQNAEEENTGEEPQKEAHSSDQDVSALSDRSQKKETDEQQEAPSIQEPIIGQKLSEPSIQETQNQIAQKQTTAKTPISEEFTHGDDISSLSDQQIDSLLENSLAAYTSEQTIDNLLNELLLTLK